MGVARLYKARVWRCANLPLADLGLSSRVQTGYRPRIVISRQSHGKAYMEAVYLQGRSNPFLDLADQASDHLLLLNIQIVKGEHMPARGDHHVAVGQGSRMRHGNRVVGDDPRLFRVDVAIHADGQVNAIAPARPFV
jgi:hypothetical protein